MLLRSTAYAVQSQYRLPLPPHGTLGMLPLLHTVILCQSSLFSVSFFGLQSRNTKTIISKHLEESLLCRMKVLTRCSLAEKREERNIGCNISGYSWNSTNLSPAMQSLLGWLYVSYISWTDLFLLHFMPLTHDTYKSCPLNFSTLSLLLFTSHCHCLNVGPHFSPG